MGFFNDHNHTYMSNLRLIDCINKPKDLIDRAIQLGLSGVAITDHEALCCHIEVNKYAAEIREKYPDFTIALGNEIYLTETREKKQPYYHFILIAKDALGHKALRILSSKAWYNSYSSGNMLRVPTLKSEVAEVMKEYKGHVIATTACIGGEASKLLLEKYKLIQANISDNGIHFQLHSFINWCIDTFGQDDFYIECAPGESPEQIIANRMLLTHIAQPYGLKMVPGTDSHYLSKDLRFAHKAYLNSKDGDREVDAFYEYAYLMDEAECRTHLRASYDDATIDWMFNCSEEMRRSISFYDLTKSQQIPLVEVKNYPKLYNVLNDKYNLLNDLFSSDEIQERAWINECWNRLTELGLNNNDEYLNRLQIEADVIKYIGEHLNNCLFAYFNTFKHYIDLFWECGSIVGPGRGSATGFLSNYLLGITQLDPIKWNLQWWRFLNKERAELPDIDIDLAPSVRPLILKAIKEERGELGCVQVATFGTEGAKSAIQTACRGYRHINENGEEEYPNGIDNDIALYISSLIPQERGILWSINDCVNGNETTGRKPIKSFITEVNKYPGLLNIIVNIEGLVKQRGIHASGVILYNNNIFDSAAIMRAPSGEITTCYDLHMCEAAGDTKYDFLVTDICDKMAKCLYLLEENNKIEKDNLRNIYNKYLHPEIIDTTRKEIWDHLAAGDILDVFQFNSGSGLAIAKQTRPQNPLEMTAANAMMRLMSEPGVESQQDRYVRIRDGGLQLFDKEMQNRHLPQEVIEAMHEYCDTYFGCCAIQEQMMQILMDKRIAGFTLKQANDARKVVAKKQLKKIPELRELFYDCVGKIYSNSKDIGDYVWDVAVRPSLGYAFSINHSLPYSFVGIQSIELATRFNPVYWNTACLIVNSGSLDPESNNSTDYGKIAKAVNDIKERGINIVPVDINKSRYEFYPDEENNQILFGMKGLLKVGDDVVSQILKNAPYKDFLDFLRKTFINKQAMISLIKCGAFDHFDDRKKIMIEYIWRTCDKKEKINLQNMPSLLRNNMLPDELKQERSVYEFNRYLKDKCFTKGQTQYILDDRAINFLNKNSIDLYAYLNNKYVLDVKTWDKYYQKAMDPIRIWAQTNQSEILYQLNKLAFKNDWDKYAQGSYSAWEMEVMCFYNHEHELAHVNNYKYGIMNYFELPEDPVVETLWKGKIPIYKLCRIAGTVIARNKTTGDVTLLTTEGVINVWFNKEFFAMFDRQISERGSDGKKHIIEKSWFSRGSKIVVTGMRRGDEFVAKKYSATPGHQLYKIDKILENGDLVLRAERAHGEEEDAEE